MVVFHCSLSDTKSPQVSRTLLSIQANRNNAVVWMISILPLTSDSSSSLSAFSWTVPSAPTIIGNTVKLSFFSCLASFKYLSLFLVLSFLLNGPLELQNPLNGEFSFLFFSFLLITTCSGLLGWSRWFVVSQKSLCVTFFRMDSGLGIHHLVVGSNFNFLHSRSPFWPCRV